jgi:hypothetical protein
LRTASESLLFCAKGQRVRGRELERMARILGELGLGRMCEDFLGVHDLADAIRKVIHLPWLFVCGLASSARFAYGLVSLVRILN